MTLVVKRGLVALRLELNIPSITHTASSDTVQKALVNLRAFRRYTDAIFLLVSWTSSASAQIEIPQVSTQVTTNDSKIFLLCFRPATFGISRDKLVLNTDALESKLSTCYFKLSRASISTFKYRTNGFDVSTCFPTFSVNGFHLLSASDLYCLSSVLC